MCAFCVVSDHTHTHTSSTARKEMPKQVKWNNITEHSRIQVKSPFLFFVIYFTFYRVLLFCFSPFCFLLLRATAALLSMTEMMRPVCWNHVPRSSSFLSFACPFSISLVNFLLWLSQKKKIWKETRSVGFDDGKQSRCGALHSIEKKTEGWVCIESEPTK